jgi:hypothetical protein
LHSAKSSEAHQRRRGSYILSPRTFLDDVGRAKLISSNVFKKKFWREYVARNVCRIDSEPFIDSDSTRSVRKDKWY